MLGYTKLHKVGLQFLKGLLINAKDFKVITKSVPKRYIGSQDPGCPVFSMKDFEALIHRF